MLSGIVLSTFITLGGWSSHFEPTYKLCDSDNPELGCTKEKFNYSHNMIMVDYKGFTVSTFKNSYYSKSYLMGYTYRYNNFSVLAGASTGYERGNRCDLDFGKYCAVVSLSYSFRPLKLTLVGQAVAVSFEFKL